MSNSYHDINDISTTDRPFLFRDFLRTFQLTFIPVRLGGGGAIWGRYSLQFGQMAIHIEWEALWGLILPAIVFGHAQ
jgi:hypothetical protein